MGNLVNPELPTLGKKQQSKKAQEKTDVIFDVRPEVFEEFPNFIDCGLISSTKLMGIISDAMSLILPDFAGCFIAPYPNGSGYDVRFYFADKGDDVTNDQGKLIKARVFKNSPESVKESQSQILNTLNAISNIPKRKMYYMTTAGKQFMSKFMAGGDPSNVNKINWDNFATEIDEYRQNMKSTYAVIFGIDLYRVLSYIFGNKDENGEYYTYTASVAYMKDAVNSLLCINRVSNYKVNELSRELGYVSRDSIMMVRPTSTI